MGTAENVDVVRRGYEAFNSGDMATLSGLFAEDAVWHVAGNGVLSGTKQGRAAVLAYFGELGSRTQGSFRADVQDIVGGDQHTIAIHQTRGERNSKTLDTATVIAFVVRGGKIAQAREFSEDTAKVDDFWT